LLSFFRQGGSILGKHRFFGEIIVSSSTLHVNIERKKIDFHKLHIEQMKRRERREERDNKKNRQKEKVHMKRRRERVRDTKREREKQSHK
jgi:hypothetical protein